MTVRRPRVCEHCRKGFYNLQNPNRGRFCSLKCRDGFKMSHCVIWDSFSDNKDGYRCALRKIPSGGRKHIWEHVLVMERHLGRPIFFPRETIHHINGDHSDNRVENLELKIGHHGSGSSFTSIVESVVDSVKSKIEARLLEENLLLRRRISELEMGRPC